MIGFHIQWPVPDWPKAISYQPAGTPNKFFQVQAAAEAKARNPETKTILRHFYDHGQLFEGDYRNRARTYLKTFIDGTFDTLAHTVDYIESWNETLANSQNDAERQARIDWEDALTSVWNDEFRPNPLYKHIKIILANAAIGNDIPWQIAKIAYERGHILGYHPYMPMRDGVAFTNRGQSAASRGVAAFMNFVEPVYRANMRDVDSGLVWYPVKFDEVLHGEEAVNRLQKLNVLASGVDDGRRYFWLRWQYMDAEYRSRGIYPQWMFTESGPLNYSEHAWGLHLDAGGGWRHQQVCNGNVKQYVNACLLFQNEMAAWNKDHGNRALGAVLFTTNGGMSSIWNSFETKQPEMDLIAAAVKANVGTPYIPPVDPPTPTPNPTPTPEPEDPAWLAQAWDKSVERQTISLNPSAALQKAIYADGFVPVETEWWEDFGDGKHAFMAAENLSTGVRRLYYAPEGEWNNVKWYIK